MKIEFITSHWTTNSYYVESNGESIIIDASDISITKKVEIAPKAILITHGHIDHIEVLEELRSDSIPVYIQETGQEMLVNPEMNTSAFFPQFKTTSCQEAEHVFKGDEFTFKFGDVTLHTMHTPGHSPDSSIFYDKKRKIVFAGDLIFENSIGRSDFDHSNTEEHLKNVELVLNNFEDDWMVYPGHGKPFKLGDARTHILMVVNWVKQQAE